MKVKSFKLLPGVKHTGVDNSTLHNYAESERAVLEFSAGPTAEENRLPPRVLPGRREDVNTRKFQDKFVLSVDGERYNPGHGIVCEVHQGLARFLSDSRLQKYQPTVLHRPVKAQPAAAEEEDESRSEAERRMARWMNDCANGLAALSLME